MVFIVVEHLLSSSSNRGLYESLWNLAINKRSKKPTEMSDASITSICQQLINEINRDDPDPNKFYFSTQLCYGAVLLYRSQIDKLYDQVKTAHQNCTVTLYDINWLSTLNDEESESHFSIFKGSQKVGRGKTAKGQTKEPPKKRNVTDLDLIEEAFTIPDLPVKKTNKSTRADEDEIDPTMATNSRHITITESRVHNHPTALEFDFDQMNEFGALDTEEFELSFHAPALHSSAKVDTSDHQVVPQVEDAAHADPEISPLPANPPGNFEHTLAEDVTEIVNQQRLQKKRRSSNDNDITTRLDSKKQRLATPDERNPAIDTSPFELNANGLEVELPVDQPILFNSTFSGQENANFIRAASELASSQLSPIRTVARSKKGKKLVIDKQTKIKDAVLKKEVEYYQRNCTVPMPISSNSFFQFIQALKNSIDKCLGPTYHFTHCSSRLTSAYLRGLKRVSERCLKRRRNTDEDDVAEAVKPLPKRQSQRRALSVSNRNDEQPEMPSNIQNISISGIEPIACTSKRSSVVCQATVADKENFNPLQFDIENFEAFPLHSIETNVVSAKDKTTGTKQKYKETSDEIYHECDKWSKHQIMERLNGFWKKGKKQEPVTMSKLTRKTNRFVAAGIFFELMSLAKAGAIELSQGDGLEITNILPGKHCWKALARTQATFNSRYSSGCDGRR